MKITIEISKINGEDKIKISDGIHSEYFDLDQDEHVLERCRGMLWSMHIIKN